MSELSPDDIVQFRASARAAFGTDRGTADVRRHMSTAQGWDVTEWRRLAADLDLPGLMLPPEHGGTGLTAEGLGHAVEEAGYALHCSPLFGTCVLAVPLLVAIGDDPLCDYGPRIASGELTATVAVVEADGRWATDSVRARAEETPVGWRVDGTKEIVVDGLTAGLLLVVARLGDGVGVLAVETDEGVTRTPLVTLDQTRKLARLTFQHTPARLLARGEDALEQATAVARALHAAEQTGGAQRCLDMSVEYARTRFQFARPIGTFQAIKQRLADMLIQVESSRSAAYAATRAAAGHDPDLPTIARIAAVTAADANQYVAAQTIQLHGGIGFTWEHDAHLFYKRARSSAVLLGAEADHVEHLARAMMSAIA